MADATDLKSVDRKVVWVRLPPSAPIILNNFQSATAFAGATESTLLGLSMPTKSLRGYHFLLCRHRLIPRCSFRTRTKRFQHDNDRRSEASELSGFAVLQILNDRRTTTYLVVVGAGVGGIGSFSLVSSEFITLASPSNGCAPLR